MEESKKGDFALDWVLLESKGNSMAGYANCFYLGCKSGNLEVKAVTGKETPVPH